MAASFIGCFEPEQKPPPSRTACKRNPISRVRSSSTRSEERTSATRLTPISPPARPAPAGLRSRHRVLRENRIAQNSEGGSVGKRSSKLAPCHPKPPLPSTPSRFYPCNCAGDFERRRENHGANEFHISRRGRGDHLDTDSPC